MARKGHNSTRKQGYPIVMRKWFSLYREALARYLPRRQVRALIAPAIFVLIYIGYPAGPEGRSSEGLTPLVAATVVLLLIAIYTNFAKARSMIFALDRIVRDAVLATLGLIALLLVAGLVLLNSDLVAMRYYTFASLGYALIYGYGAVHRAVLTDYLIWPFRGLRRGVGRAGRIMAGAYLLSALLAEWVIAQGSMAEWVLLRALWPLIVVRLAYMVIIADQLSLRRAEAPAED